MKKKLVRNFLILLLILAIPSTAYADYGTIQIDGYYDDWEDKPHTEVYNGQNPPASKINYVSLFRDETNAYIHVIFASINNQDIKNMTINLYTNLGDENYYIVPDRNFPFDEMNSENLELYEGQDKETYLNSQDLNAADITAETNQDGERDEPNPDTYEEEMTEPAMEETTEPAVENPNADQDEQADPAVDEMAVPDPENPNTDQDDPGEPAGQDFMIDLQEAQDPLEPDSALDYKNADCYGTWAFTVYHRQQAVGSGYFTRSWCNPDEMEFNIPLSTITNQPDGITEISMKIKKLGKQHIICVGAGTGPYVGIALTTGLAMVSFGYYNHKKKRTFVLSKGK